MQKQQASKRLAVFGRGVYLLSNRFLYNCFDGNVLLIR